MPLAANPILEDWNHVPQEIAAETILACNGSHAWAALLASRRPFATPDELLSMSDEVWRSLPAEDWQQAFDSHPRIGEKHARAASAVSEQWSSDEQRQAQADAATAAALAEANKLYEAKFGRIFLVCATGKTAAEILALLLERMNNDPEAELLQAAEQQRQITRLRLRRWLQLSTEAH